MHALNGVSGLHGSCAGTNGDAIRIVHGHDCNDLRASLLAGQSQQETLTADQQSVL
jgi:hypothetical protein